MCRKEKKGMSQMVKCSCNKKWKVFWYKVFILECTTCDYRLRIKNPNQFLKYRTLHEQQSGHTGALLYEDPKL